MIPLGFNPARLPSVKSEKVAAIRAEYKHKKIIFALGRQVVYKGFDYLIRSAQFLNDDYMVLIGGKGPLYETNLELIKTLNLSHRVQMLGFIADEDIPAYYEASNIFVLSSISKAEAFGMVQLEAMYFGKPIVSTAIPCSGVSWVNQHNETGYIVPPADAQALAEAILAIQTSGKADFFAQNARERVSTLFSSDNLATQFTQLYRESLGLPIAENVNA